MCWCRPYIRGPQCDRPECIPSKEVPLVCQDRETVAENEPRPLFIACSRCRRALPAGEFKEPFKLGMPSVCRDCVSNHIAIFSKHGQFKAVYIAGKFRAPDGWQVHQNVIAAERAAREIIRMGALPLVPHTLGEHMQGTESDLFWLNITLEMMRRCDAVLVLPGWETSEGTKGEIKEATRLGMPLFMPTDKLSDGNFCEPNYEGVRNWLNM